MSIFISWTNMFWQVVHCCLTSTAVVAEDLLSYSILDLYWLYSHTIIDFSPKLAPPQTIIFSSWQSSASRANFRLCFLGPKDSYFNTRRFRPILSIRFFVYFMFPSTFWPVPQYVDDHYHVGEYVCCARRSSTPFNKSWTNKEIYYVSQNSFYSST